MTLDRLRQAKSNMEAASLDPLLAKEAQMKVCEVCGAMQNLHNVEKRSTSHVEGKQHKAYEKIREWLVRLRARIERRKSNPDYNSLIQKYKEKETYDKNNIYKEKDNKTYDSRNYYDTKRKREVNDSNKITSNKDKYTSDKLNKIIHNNDN